MTADVKLSEEELSGYVTGGGGGDARLQEQISACIRLISGAASPRFVTLSGALTRRGDGIALDGTMLVMRGRDIAAHLAQCGEAVIFCATLGHGVDRKIDECKATDLAMSYLLDTAGSLLAEKVCEAIEEQIRAEAAAAGKGITTRFSCGYGDFPLDQQDDFLAALGAQKRLGVMVTGTHLMVPRKSVTAVVGVGGEGIRKSGRCDVCPYRDACKEKLCCGKK